MEEEHGQPFLKRKLFGLPMPAVLAGGAVLLWFVLAHRSAGSPVAQAPQGPQASDFGGGAAQQQQDGLRQDQGGYDDVIRQLYGQADSFKGVISGVWQQVPGGWVNTGQKNQAAKGSFLSEEAAQTLGPQNKGPYAQAKPQWWQQALAALPSLLPSSGLPVGGGQSKFTLYPQGPTYTPAPKQQWHAPMVVKDTMK